MSDFDPIASAVSALVTALLVFFLRKRRTRG